jgi:hypothetical protein
MAKKGKGVGAFKGAHSANRGKVGVGAKVNHFNSKMPGGNGATKKGRVVVAGKQAVGNRVHDQNGSVTAGNSRRTPGGHAKPRQTPRKLPATSGSAVRGRSINNAQSVSPGGVA